MIPEIEINNQTLQKMTEQVLNPLDQALSVVIHQTSSPCIQAAKRFLISIRSAYEELAAANLIAKHQHKLKKSYIGTLE